MTKKPVELLAPAGSPEAYRAAAMAGADAVYLGTKGFNARQLARNFSLCELSETIEDAHIRGIKLYLVLNTLIAESEIHQAVEFASFAYKEGIDGMIVQDLGLAHQIKNYLPGLPLHASTQMTIHNTDGAKALQAMGIERVVLARELSLSEITRIVESTRVEAEVFIHGAMCISRSGQCLLSSFIGGRSGNRGRCAQPCRLPWRMDAKKTVGDYLLSPKDLMTLHLLPEILDTGVCALKIEGRMKSPEYVAVVVEIYRKYLDIAMRNPKDYRVHEEDIDVLMQVFNRGGFSTGYLKGRNFDELMCTALPKHWGIRVGTISSQKGNNHFVKCFQKDRVLLPVQLDKPIQMGDGLEIWDSKNENPSTIISIMLQEGRHVKTAKAGDMLWVGNFKSEAASGSEVYKTYDKNLMERMSCSIQKNVPRVPLSGTIRLFAGENPVFTISDQKENCVKLYGKEPAQKATHKPMTVGRIREQLNKTGDTPYIFEKISIQTDDDSYLPVSELNDMRREALRRISAMRSRPPKRPESTKIEIQEKHFPGNAPNLSKDREISLLFYDIPYNMNWDGFTATRIYLPVTALHLLEEVQKQGMKGYVWSPAVLHDQQMDRFIKEISPYSHSLDGILAGNPGSLHRFRKAFPEIPLAIDFPMNVYNSWAVKELERVEPISITLSPELNLKDISEINSGGTPLEALVYGEVPVMMLEYCPGSNYGDCNQRCGDCRYSQGYLSDRLGKKFLYRTDPDMNRTLLFNSSRLMLEEVAELKQTCVRMIRVSILNETAEEVHALYRFYSRRWTGECPDALTDEKGLQTIKSKSITRGHYFRGVE